jgi:hypothetical protein
MTLQLNHHPFCLCAKCSEIWKSGAMLRYINNGSPANRVYITLNDEESHK